MKTMLALTALVSVSSVFADEARLRTVSGVQTLTISGRTRAGIPSPGALGEVPGILMKATRVLKVKRLPDASFYKGDYVSGSNSCPAGWCIRELVIEQKSDEPDQSIKKSGPDSYLIKGDAARELYDALANGGVKIVKSTSKTPSTSVRGASFGCVSNPLGGAHYSCTVSINENLN